MLVPTTQQIPMRVYLNGLNNPQKQSANLPAALLFYT